MKKLNRIINFHHLIKSLMDYLSYPIRYLLRHKVECYKAELELIRWKQRCIKYKIRRFGMDETVFNFMMIDILRLIKYERFIKKWSL